MPAGIPKIDVEFLIDANGILNVSAREQRSGTSANVQVIPFHGLTRDEVRRIEVESVLYAREDMTTHRLIDLRNQIEFDTHKTQQTLERYGHLLSEGERQSLSQAISELRQTADSSTDADRLHRELDAFGRRTAGLANIAITEALREDRPHTAAKS
jgi:molecular chaperone DnaK (HSP70)